MTSTPSIERVHTATYRFPTAEPEADGTLTWDATTMVTVTLESAGSIGLGWTYTSPATAAVIAHHLAEVVQGRPVDDIGGGWEAMHRAGRNVGSRGLYAQAMSAVDIAWWDLKAHLQGQPMTALMGRCRESVPLYGSGGFTTLSDEQLGDQVDQWRAAGCRAMKIKIGQDWGSRIDRDLARVETLREVAGAGAELMVDANGGYSIGTARRVGHALDELGVVWFEEPVSSDDTDGLARLRTVLACDIAAGEYASDLRDVALMLPAVDCLQLDVTRCGGYTGWLRAAAAATAAETEVSAHCAPSLHACVGAAVPNLRHVEWFADHVRLEAALFDNIPDVRAGAIWPNTTGAGHGMTVNADAERWKTEP